MNGESSGCFRSNFSSTAPRQIMRLLLSTSQFSPRVKVIVIHPQILSASSIWIQIAEDFSDFLVDFNCFLKGSDWLKRVVHIENLLNLFDATFVIDPSPPGAKRNLKMSANFSPQKRGVGFRKFPFFRASSRRRNCRHRLSSLTAGIWLKKMPLWPLIKPFDVLWSKKQFRSESAAVLVQIEVCRWGLSLNTFLWHCKVLWPLCVLMTESCGKYHWSSFQFYRSFERIQRWYLFGGFPGSVCSSVSSFFRRRSGDSRCPIAPFATEVQLRIFQWVYTLLVLIVRCSSFDRPVALQFDA